MNNLLFVYGTLLQTENEFGVYLNKNCSFLGEGKVNGTLYDIGEYPGLTINNHSETFVYGHIYQMKHPEIVLNRLDFYEGVGPTEEQPNLYTRQLIPVETSDGIVSAWTYIYNLPVIGYPIIASGNYIEYLKQKKSSG
ncbi:gamma-glutamylcyclotransferase [Inquilinus sp. KBS0705]|nr:gamma-glutamylcyclotransferase [Inquilinus sp. KBS0705]